MTQPAAGDDDDASSVPETQDLDLSPETSPPRVMGRIETSFGPIPSILLRAEAALPAAGFRPGADGPTSAAMSGRYQVLGEIARGGMGAVLRGRDTRLNRDLAIKVLLERYADNPEVLGRFLEEAQIGGQLQHPGILPIYDLGRFADDRPFFAMKLVKGRTLAEMLKARTSHQDDLPEFLRIFQQICETMAYAHSKGVIHRDLKPLNIMVGAFGEVQVMDWGLAKVLGREGSTESEAEASVIRTDRGDSDLKLTQVGDLMGTVAYMSPEQARGEMNRLDERADVFALGSILCEVLTGKAAYTGRSSQELLDKAKIGALPEALNRLDACGAEPELIAIATSCLSPIAQDRPRDAAEVARLTKAYLDGVQERLRAAEIARVEANARAEHEQQARILHEAKAAQERRARRLTAALAAAVLAAGMIGGGSWLAFRLDRESQLARTDRVVGDALARAETLHAEAKRSGLDDLDAWTRAASAAEAARQSLSGRPGRADLSDRVGRAYATIVEGTQQARDRAERRESGRKLIAALEEARLQSARVKVDQFDLDAKLKAYEKAFRDAGIDAANRPPEESARLLDRRGDSVQIAAALDDWHLYEADKVRKASLSSLARRIDPDPYRNRVRDAIAGINAASLVDLARTEEAGSLPAESVRQLAYVLDHVGKRAEAISLLDRSRRRFPVDFWIHHDLGAILGGDPAQRVEGIRFLSVAVALKPDSPGAYLNLGRAFYVLKRYAEAEASYRAAIRLKPDYFHAQLSLCDALAGQSRHAEAEASLRAMMLLKPNDAEILARLGNALSGQGRHQEAEAACRAALLVKPNSAQAHLDLGVALSAQGRRDEAEASLRAAIGLEPELAEAYKNLGPVLLHQGRYAEAEASLRQSLLLNPDNASALNNLGALLTVLGRQAEAEEACRAALRLEPELDEALYNLGYALTAQGKHEEAEASLRKSLRLKPNVMLTHYGLGNVLAAQGKHEEAEASFRDALRLGPDFAEANCNLGHSLQRQGRFVEALASLRKGHELGLKRPGWSYPSAEWVADCEAMVRGEARLKAILRGEAKPTDNADRLALALVGYHTRHYGAAARLWGEALADDPKLGEARETEHRYNGACAAALAGSGRGIDDPKPDESARADLRAKARGWVAEELAAWAKFGESGKAEDRQVVAGKLTHWKQDADLAGVRNAGALARLPEEERKAWQALWADVDRLLKKVGEP